MWRVEHFTRMSEWDQTTGGIDMKNLREKLNIVKTMLFTILILRFPEWKQEIEFVGTNR